MLGERRRARGRMPEQDLEPIDRENPDCKRYPRPLSERADEPGPNDDGDGYRIGDVLNAISEGEASPCQKARERESRVANQQQEYSAVHELATEMRK